jgi:hypothetical protein
MTPVPTPMVAFSSDFNPEAPCSSPQIVKDLVTGSGLGVEDIGEHTLEGLPQRWHLCDAVDMLLSPCAWGSSGRHQLLGEVGDRPAQGT